MSTLGSFKPTVLTPQQLADMKEIERRLELLTVEIDKLEKLQLDVSQFRQINEVARQMINGLRAEFGK